MMKPILFNTEMVRAILEGRKTVTRRVIKPQPTYSHADGFTYKGVAYGTDSPPTIKGAGYNLRCVAPYKVNDVLYVREIWYKGLNRILYKANYSDTEKFYENGKEILLKWKPSIHMPKEAARIFLRVTDVRVERLQDICNRRTPQDHVKNITREGLRFQAVMENYQKLIDDFKLLWDSTIKCNQINTYGWKANPYVWVIEFEVIDKAAVFESEAK